MLHFKQERERDEWEAKVRERLRERVELLKVRREEVRKDKKVLPRLSRPS